MKSSEDMPDIVKAHCNGCGDTRNHYLLFTERNIWTETYPDGEPAFDEVHVYELLKCCGCDRVTTRVTETAPYLDEPYVRYFPPALSRKLPSWLYTMQFSVGERGKYIGELLKQIYAAVQNGLHALAVMGVRALIEFIMINSCKDNGSFRKNLSAFQSAGYVSTKQAELLDVVLEVGHAAIHRGHLPKEEDVSAVIDIVENVIETVYVHRGAADSLKGTTPSRS